MLLLSSSSSSSSSYLKFNTDFAKPELYMAANSPSFQKDHANFPDPPKRANKIKAQIFKGLVKSVASAVSKAGKSLGKVTGAGNGGGSASSTPPTSTYNSDAS